MSAPYYQDDAVTLWHGDSLAVLRTMPDASVDCCVTSPPYFGLRDYGVEGQMGAESSPAEYVEGMRALFAEVRRVLADDGTLWLNLGDSYSGSWGNQGRKAERGTQRAVNGPMITPVHDGRYPDAGSNTGAIKPGAPPAKNLMGMPWRTAFALQDDGWILRQEIIWSKRNCMPEAVTDRPSRSHETVFLLSKKPRYWYDADAIREDSDPKQEAHNERYAKVYAAQADRAATTGQPGNQNNAGVHSRPGKPGRNARSVWTISSQPYPGAHFATMPPALAERCVLAGCKPGGVVLDPFSGSGTTGMAAAKHGRKYVGIDLKADYLADSLHNRLAQPGFNFEESA
jgi:DNA modification methylase